MDVVIGLHNSAGEVFNVTHIAGSINAPQAFQYYVQNFTFQVTFSPPLVLVIALTCQEVARCNTVTLFPCELSLDHWELCYAAVQLTVEAGRAGVVAVHIQTR